MHMWNLPPLPITKSSNEVKVINWEGVAGLWEMHTSGAAMQRHPTLWPALLHACLFALEHLKGQKYHFTKNTDNTSNNTSLTWLAQVTLREHKRCVLKGQKVKEINLHIIDNSCITNKRIFVFLKNYISVFKVKDHYFYLCHQSLSAQFEELMFKSSIW